jgi:receptor protein-tyrosine kinase
MSRLDEALARARQSHIEEVIPAVAPTAALDTQYPAEADAEIVPAETAEPPVPTASARAEAGPVDGEAPVGVIDALADITRLPSSEKLMLNFGESVPVEQYRRLAARLLLAQAEKNVRVVMVTSAFPAEGKTLTSTNLALTLSESYKRKVLLVDADLRHPWVHQVFQIPNVSGLNDGLRDSENGRIPLLSYTDNLSILTAGRPDPDPMSVLSGARVSRVLEEARARFDWIIIDTPPVALLTDAHLLSSQVDAVVLIVQAAKTPLPAIKKAVDAVGRDRILGVVLNRLDRGTPEGAYAYYGSAYRTTEKV